MPRSSTSYRPKWKFGKTTVLRVPKKLAAAVLRYAHELDEQADDTDFRTDANRNAMKPLWPSQKAPMSDVNGAARANFAIAFSNWRRENRILLKSIAMDLGVSIATVNSWETGERFPSVRHFEMLLNITGLPPCRLLYAKADLCVPADCGLAAKTAAKPA